MEEGKLTQGQADEYRAWMESKPDMPPVHPGRLDQLVEEGVITQEQADAYRSWLEAKPDIPLPNPQMQRNVPRGKFGGGVPDGFKGTGQPLTV